MHATTQTCKHVLLQAETVAKKPEEDEERHNFALAKDGAKIVAANKEARKPESVLDSDGDTFLKNECKADKWIVIELSQVTKIDMIRLSQVSFPAPHTMLHTALSARSPPM